MQTTILKTRRLCKTYVSGGEEVRATRDMNLEVYDKDFTVIMGSSGSGKTTLLYLLSGMDKVTSGEVIFNGERIDGKSEKQISVFRRKNVGFVFQSINLLPNLTMLENILVPGYMADGSKGETVARGKELLGAMGLSKETNRLPSQVSGGQQQRGAIARALINKPRVLFADEPTGSLNSSQGQNVLDVLTKLNNEGQTIVMVTHDAKAAIRANRILFIVDGELSGELQMERYTGKDLEVREKKVLEWLTEKGW